MINYKEDGQGNVYVCVDPGITHLKAIEAIVLASMQTFIQKNWGIKNPGSIKAETSLKKCLMKIQKQPIGASSKWVSILELNSAYGEGRVAEKIFCGLTILQNAKEPQKLKIVPAQLKTSTSLKKNSPDPEIALPTMLEVVLRADEILSQKDFIN